MSIIPFTIIFGLLVFFFPHGVYCHNYLTDSSSQTQQIKQSFLYKGNFVSELSPGELNKLFSNIPSLDHVVLFYINLNRDCRNFFPLYSQLYQDFISEGWNIKFVKFNCQGVDRRLKLCQEFNINTVPTLAYISSYPLQRTEVPSKAYLRRLLRFLFSEKSSDINLVNATRYKGDIFSYEQLRDWVHLMYSISTLNRKFGSREAIVQTLTSLWRSFMSFFKRW